MSTDSKNNNAKKNKKPVIDNSEDLKDRITESIDAFKLRANLLMANIKEGGEDGYDHSTTTAGEKGLKSGKVSELTVIAPLKEGGAERLKEILKIAGGNLKGATRVGTLHDLRFVFLDDDTRVLFCTAYDGDWDPYIDDFATKIPELMDILFGSVEGWPGIKDPSVKQFILDHQITAAGWYVGVPHLTIQDIRRQDRIVKGINKALDEAQS
ncbi:MULTISPECIES: hypothetical protein [Gammaproteobacteria]|mgnify:FL=1|jgi:hypothetical protein|uniref:Uncharacterized protein n=1 Tax=Shewanella electrodiphila TaxID=934143 RepID=A0ABT0KVP5_9GAMM|nr:MULTISPECIES: hypothetical protein [Gammaproteobacteria]MCL1047913.1 hypothetical protein [Shewanella electrodiphila]